MANFRVATALGVLFSLASSMLPAQGNRSTVERWVGGVRREDDYSAVVLRLWRSNERVRAEVTYPNQLRTLDFDEVSLQGGRLVLRSSLRQESWNGDRSGNGIRGDFRDPEGAGDFELFLAPDIPAATLSRWQGTYRWPDGKRIGVGLLTRPTDHLLTYFDERTGEEQWLFPETDSTYYDGPTFESPRPVRHRISFTRDSSGQSLLRWSAEDGSSIQAVHLSELPDTVALDSITRAFLFARDVPSAVIGIVGPEGLLWGKAYGYADLAKHRAATLATPYQIGSVTKLVTATVLMQLRDRGILGLEDDISGLLPPVARIRGPDGNPATGLTLRNLLTHTAGLPGNPVNRVDVDGVMQPFSNADLLAGLPHTRLQSRPGDRWSYSNLGYAILGYVMARKAGRSFEALLRVSLFEPLGMGDSRIGLPPFDESRLAVHYWPEDSIRIPRPRWVFGEVAGFGGITSTVPDLARFLSLHLRASADSALVAPATLAVMQRPHFVRTGWSQAMGLGWWIRRDAALGSILLHGGEVDGHSSYVALSRDFNFGVVVLTNLGGATANDLGELVLRESIEGARDRTIPTREWAFGRFFDADWATAAWALEPVAAARPSDGVAWFRLGVARFQLDRYADAAKAFQHASSLDFVPEQALVYLARLSAIRGERENAIGFLERAVAKGFRSMRSIIGYPEFKNMLEDPKFADLMR